MEGLRSLQIETHHIHNILKLNVHPSDTDYAVDIRNPAISVRHLCGAIRNTKITLRLKFTPVAPDFRWKVECLTSFLSFCIQWINNLETDRKYSSWPYNVQELLRPTFPGVIRQIRKNFHNLVRSRSRTRQTRVD